MKSYLSLVKFSHTVFALPFALIGFFLAVELHQYPLDWKLFGLVLLCMVTARNAAMAFNRWADRNIDADNPRTAVREIPAGIVSSSNAIWFVVINAAVFTAATWFINPLCFYLSPVALLVVLGYSFTKRYTALCHFILGLGLAIVPTAGYLAVSGTFHPLPVLLSAAVLCWVAGFDIIYALQDEDFDKKNGLHSIPASIGKTKALWLSSLLHVMSSIFIIGAGLLAEFGIWYWVGTSVFIALLYYQHRLVSADDLSRVNLAFFTTNGIASVVFMAFVLGELYL